MDAVIFHNSNCSKSRATLDILKENGVNFKIIEYLQNPPNANELKELLVKLKFNPRDLMRKGEPEYKEQNLDSNLLSEDYLIKAMVNTPKLIERPIVITNKGAVIGRPPQNVLSII